MRIAALFLLVASLLPAAPASFVQAVDFPYPLYPRAQWERELVWMKSIGVRTVVFTIPREWHQRADGVDFAGRTSPRRDLTGLLKLLRKLELQAWVRAQGHGDAKWTRELEQLLSPQTASHGGAVAYVEGRGWKLDAPAPPLPVTTVLATDKAALARSRAALMTAHGSLVWESVEDALYPGGWSPSPGPLLVKGAVALNGEERGSTAALRRNADLLKEWAALLPAMKAAPLPKPAAGKFPEAVTAVELISGPASVVNITNGGAKEFQDDLRVVEPQTRRVLTIPGVKVPPGESLWLPLGVSIGLGGLCRNCGIFSSAEHIVYATAELHAVEFENGILSMEFAAPVEGEVILQLARQPVGPFLAGGKPTKFDFDEKTLRARLTIPAGKGAGARVRIGLAIEAPETSAFFADEHRLLIGKTNRISTMYSSPEVAQRARLKLPEGWTAKAAPKSPNEIDYDVDVPADALHGDWATLALEADGNLMGRTRLQLFRPASIRWADAVRLRYAPMAELPVEPPTAPADAKTGRNVEIVIRNNSPHIENYVVEASGAGLTFSPARMEISVGAVMERTVSLRVFPEEGSAGVRDWRLRVSGGATADLPMRLVLIPRGQTVAWSADLDGDGTAEWVLESAKMRAVFSSQDGGRWLEFTWKDLGMNFVPEGGLWAASDGVDVKASGDTLVFSNGRTVRLHESQLTVEGAPAEGLTEEKRGNLSLRVTHDAGRVVYAIE